MLDIEKLNYQERASYQNILAQYKINQITVTDLKLRVADLLFAATRELVEIESSQDEKNIYLKARIKNYLVLLDILTAPEEAERQMSEALKKLEKRVGDK